MISDVLEALEADGLLDKQAAEQVRARWAAGGRLDDAILEAAAGDEQRVLPLLAARLGIPVVALDQQLPSRQLVAKYPARILLEHRLLPIAEENGSVLVASSRLFDNAGIDELRVVSGRQVRLALAPADQIDRALKQTVAVGADTIETLASDKGIEVIDETSLEDMDLEEAAQDASIVKFVNQVLSEAVASRATDVHFEPFEDQLQVRYRVDGVLIEANIPQSIARFRPAIVSRLKILAHLDIAEKRMPQDGRIKLKVSGREIDVRVSVIPMLHGEAVVLRILDRTATLLGLEHLGMSDRDNAHFERVLELPHGIVLVTGPTGSGKTTSLYAGLSRINTVDRKIVTIEDPVEYQLRGVNQIQVAEKTGLTFAAGLRAILRHDPDVVLIGEIRDRETAQIAVQASLTGHLVFSTLHTNDAPGALTRLVDMGIEPYLVASSLELVIAQRLVRIICTNCKTQVPHDEAHRLLAELGLTDIPELYHGVGCRQCQNVGFKGRRGIFEMMPMTEQIQSMMLEHASAGQMRRLAIEQGMTTLRQDGLRMVGLGNTTLQEVMRVTKDQTVGSSSPSREGGTNA